MKYKLKQMEIGQLLNLKRGYDLTKNEMINGKFPVVGSNGIIGFHNAFNCKNPCITVGRSGSVGATHLYKQDCWIHNTCLFVDDFKGNDPFYIFYLLKILNLDKLANSTSTPTLNRNFIHPLKIRVYADIEMQKKIGRILSNIDEKIAVNNEINKLLEQSARAIYEYYFVQFDFPNANGKPYKSSGGEMIFNPTLNHHIPKTFEVISLKEICEVKSGYPFSTNDYNENGQYKIITIKNVLDGYISIHTDNAIDFIPSNMPDYCMLKMGDILLSLTGNVGRVGIVFENNLLLNQRVGILNLKNKNYRSFVYLTFLQQHFKSILENISTGSNQKNLSPIEIERLFLAFSQEIVAEFEFKTKHLIDQIINNHKENEKLKALRDFLLPLLLNAQVKIK